MELIPGFHVFGQRHANGGVVDENVHHPLFLVSHDALAPDEGRSLKFHPAHNAVPVSLRLVGHRVRILAHTDILDAIIDPDGNLVLLAGFDVGGDIVAMGSGERNLVTHLLSVDENGGFDVGSLQIECQLTALPHWRHTDLAPIPSCSHIVALGGEEEGKLHVLLPAILLHIGIEVVRGVVERTGPLGARAHRSALAVGQHGTRQVDVVIVSGFGAHVEIPLTG